MQPILVFARVRPVRAGRSDAGGAPPSSVAVLRVGESAGDESAAADPNAVRIASPRATAESLTFRFHGVFGDGADQATVYEHAVAPLVDAFLAGTSCSVLLYGQTGSGKTYTLSGGGKFKARGVIPRVIGAVFRGLEAAGTIITSSVAVPPAAAVSPPAPGKPAPADGSESFALPPFHAEHPTASLHCAYFELYNENAFDLLDERNSDKPIELWSRVVVRENGRGEIVLRNLRRYHVSTERDVLNLLFLGNVNRMTAETPMNHASSRSHCIFVLTLVQRAAGSDVVRTSKFLLVDLAGSERIYKTGVAAMTPHSSGASSVGGTGAGVTVREGKHINLSLHHLEQVIIALQQQATAAGARPHAAAGRASRGDDDASSVVTDGSRGTGTGSGSGVAGGGDAPRHARGRSGASVSTAADSSSVVTGLRRWDGRAAGQRSRSNSRSRAGAGSGGGGGDGVRRGSTAASVATAGGGVAAPSVAGEHASMPATPSHVPYRNCMLTSLLRDALGGNCRTIIIATLNPEPDFADETMSTCRFAARCATLTTHVSVNETRDVATSMALLREKNRALAAALAAAEARLAVAATHGGDASDAADLTNGSAGAGTAHAPAAATIAALPPDWHRVVALSPLEVTALEQRVTRFLRAPAASPPPSDTAMAAVAAAVDAAARAGVAGEWAAQLATLPSHALVAHGCDGSVLPAALISAALAGTAHITAEAAARVAADLPPAVQSLLHLGNHLRLNGLGDAYGACLLMFTALSRAVKVAGDMTSALDYERARVHGAGATLESAMAQVQRLQHEVSEWELRHTSLAAEHEHLLAVVRRSAAAAAVPSAPAPPLGSSHAATEAAIADAPMQLSPRGPVGDAHAAGVAVGEHAASAMAVTQRLDRASSREVLPPAALPPHPRPPVPTAADAAEFEAAEAQAAAAAATHPPSPPRPITPPLAHSEEHRHGGVGMEREVDSPATLAALGAERGGFMDDDSASAAFETASFMPPPSAGTIAAATSAAVRAEVEALTRARAARDLLVAGSIFIKHGRRGRPHVRFVWVDGDFTAVHWRAVSDSAPSEVASHASFLPFNFLHRGGAAAGGSTGAGGGAGAGSTSSRGAMPLAGCLDALPGRATAVFHRSTSVRDDACFSIIAPDRTLDLEVYWPGDGEAESPPGGAKAPATAVSPAERAIRDKWVAAFKLAIAALPMLQLSRQARGGEHLLAPPSSSAATAALAPSALRTLPYSYTHDSDGFAAGSVAEEGGDVRFEADSEIGGGSGTHTSSVAAGPRAMPSFSGRPSTDSSASRAGGRGGGLGGSGLSSLAHSRRGSRGAASAADFERGSDVHSLPSVAAITSATAAAVTASALRAVREQVAADPLVSALASASAMPARGTRHPSGGAPMPASHEA